MVLGLAWCVGILGRGYWTPDEPREADIAWRMSWQPAKAVPLLAGEAFCEKPPLTYWLAAAPIAMLGTAAWAARLPNLLYALLTALAIGALARRSAGAVAGLAAAAAIGTFLLSYQTSIWLATDAPLLAAVSIALWGLYTGFHATTGRGRLRGYTCMHAALAAGFLAKSAAAWMVPALTLATLIIWEKRWRELLRWELYAGAALQAAVILTWVWFVYAGSDGPAHLKVFFWNNLVGRFAHVDAPAELQYAAAHRNFPGKYLIELPVYLWPWTLLVAAAIRRAWQVRHRDAAQLRAVRFSAAAFVPTLLVLSLAATARNIYLAPALPGLAVLLGWWTGELPVTQDRGDVRAVQWTALLLMLAVAAFAAGGLLVEADATASSKPHGLIAALSIAGLALSAGLTWSAWRASLGGRPLLPSVQALFLAYCVLLTGPAVQMYARVDAWQNLAGIARAIGHDAAGRPLILYTPDETTRAIIDMYASSSATAIAGPADARSAERLRRYLAVDPRSAIVMLLPGRSAPPAFGHPALSTPPAVVAPAWAQALDVHVERTYALPHGRRYALLGRGPFENR
ncbi:MAG: hypothetical protein NVSMB10_03200 [Steroidobacteraceae bacterium]